MAAWRLLSFLGLFVLLAAGLCLGAPQASDTSALFQPGRPGIDHAKAKFLKQYGDRYGYGGRVDDIYAREIQPRLPAGHHYLDWTAAALYWNSQVANTTAELQQHVFGNPHSASPSSMLTDDIVEATRTDLLRFFGADPKEYTLVFTRSGTGALHMLGEIFPFTPASTFRFLTSNHNSLLGIRAYAKANNASFGSIEEAEVEEWLHSTVPLMPTTAQEGRAGASPDGGAVGEGASASGGDNPTQPPTYNLFAFPAYDNYAGVLYPLSWVKEAQARSNATHKWKVLLDAAAFVPAHPLNLTETPADFVCMSFYKLFGYPTGAGALILRRENVELLRQTYWGGGSVFLATANLDWHYFQEPPHRYEHGTLPFLDLIALRHGLGIYEQLGGVAAVERHVSAVGEYLYEQLAALKHSNGRPLVRVFGKHDHPNRREVQGSTLNFEVLGRSGAVIGYKEVGEELSEAGFHLRTGCTCNPGACYNATGVRDDEVRQLAEQKEGHFESWEWVWVHRDQLVKLPLGSIRVSLGMMSRFEDAHALVQFIKYKYTDVDELSYEELAKESGKPPSHVYPGWC